MTHRAAGDMLRSRGVPLGSEWREESRTSPYAAAGRISRNVLNACQRDPSLDADALVETIVSTLGVLEPRRAALARPAALYT